MLRELHVRNFALIEELQLVFREGLNVITGETGAGKSLLIDSVSMLLGGRVSAEMVRTGTDSARVGGLVEAEGLRDYLAELGFEPDEEGNLLLTRELSKSGKSSCRINGRAVPISLLKEVGDRLIDFHGQHDHQSLLKPAKHGSLLDSLGGVSLAQVKERVAQAFQQWRSLEEEREGLLGDEREKMRRQDLLRFQWEEIDKASLRSQEDDLLEEERKRLANGSKLIALSEEAYGGLFGDQQPGALDLLQEVRNKLGELARLDPQVESMLKNVDEAFFQLEDGALSLRDYKDKLDLDPERLEEVEDRLHLIRQLKRKYGDSIEEILAYHQEMAEELKTLDHREERLQVLEGELAEAAAVYQKEAELLRELRHGAARLLEEGIGRELAQLHMANTRFEVAFTPRTGLSADGLDQVEFLISSNPGEALKPLAKIASGGEMARIMLALKGILVQVDPISTLIFDEVDTGVGGRALQAVAEKLAALARYSQVLCVTHGPQIASFAQAHFRIAKEVRSERTVTVVQELDEGGRVDELARMLSGAQVTETSLSHAREMRELAQKYFFQA